jgi:hypothetical protein
LEPALSRPVDTPFRIGVPLPLVDSRTATALLGLVVSVGVTVLAWWYFDALAVFLILPFVPILFRRLDGREERPPVRTCPRCGFRTRDPEFDYCPRDGAELRRRE